MSVAVQGALFDSEHRRPLAGGAWIDVRPGWFDAPAALFDEVLAAVD